MAKKQTAELQKTVWELHIQGQGHTGDDESRTVSPQLNSDCEDETNLLSSRLTEHSDNHNNPYQAVNSNNSNNKINKLKCLYTNSVQTLRTHDTSALIKCEDSSALVPKCPKDTMHNTGDAR